MSHQALCIHGHFYQPPRQDVLTGEIPKEAGTAPYKNWNEKIHAECYQPNAKLGNFEHISFNIGPTLFQWMEQYDPESYTKIIEQEQVNYKRYSVGNAMAQPYNHTILPLANSRDKTTQIIWGIADFTYRFGHPPEGMWLPEAAVDLETLRIMVEQGITYTILAPWQSETPNIDVRRPYRVDLGNKRSIDVFFYHMDLSTRVSFDPASTSNADTFLTNFVAPYFQKERLSDEPELLLIASDGELYGHHQPFRDKFLARLVDGATKNRGIEVIYPGLFMQKYGVSKKCKIRENTSWSCHHGVARWMTACGCTPDATWKAPLRTGLDKIAKYLDQAYSTYMKAYSDDPWKDRNEYIRVILGIDSWPAFCASHYSGSISNDELDMLQTLMQAQIARQWMFTSCGWFFDEFDRIEPTNNVSYVAQAVYLTEKVTGLSLAKKSGRALRAVFSQHKALCAEDVFAQTYDRCRTYDFSFLRAVV